MKNYFQERPIRQSPFLRVKLYAAILLLGGVMSSSCTDHFNETNTNPLTIGYESTPTNMLFTNALVQGTLDYAKYQRGEFLYANLWSQYWANAVSGWSTDRYNMNDSWIQAYWDDYFAGFGMDAYMCQKSLEGKPGNINKINMVRIWRVWMLYRITDYFGPVPNSEAFKGNEGILTPKYDSQEKIYHFMLEELKDAEATFDPEQLASFGAADILFNSNIARWKQFANTLRMRLAMRLSDVEPDLAREHFLDAYEKGALKSNDDNVLMTCYDGSYTEKNPLSVVLSFSNERRLSKTLIDYLSENKDPRLTQMAQYPHRGLPNGLTDAELGNISHGYYAKAGRKYFRPDAPIEIIKYSEVCFLLAEAAHKGWIGTPTAKEFYHEGIEASMAFHGVSVGSYLNQEKVAWESGDPMERIHLQKWIALFPNGIEAFSEIRRTGLPAMNSIVAPANQTSTGGKYPRRVAYPRSEVAWNADNANAAMDEAGFSGNDLTSKLWWDRREEN